MSRDRFSTTWSAAFDLWQLGVEANSVIALRTFKIAKGGVSALTEANLMLTEKVAAAFEAQTALMTGRLGTSPQVVSKRLARHYGKKVRSNRKRLSRRR